MNTLASTALAIGMIAAILLAIGGIKLALRKDDRQRGLLMLAAGIVLLANVLIWTV